MNNRAFATKTPQVFAALAAMLVCGVIILAMFTAPDHNDSFRPLISTAQDRSFIDESNFVFTPRNILGLLVIGLVSGTFGGMLGMGGGVLKMSFLLLFFGFHTGVSRFAALLSYFIVAAGASYRYLKLNYVMMEAVKILIPSSIAGIVLGALIGHSLPRDILTLILGIFLLFITVVMVRRIISHFQCRIALQGGQGQEEELAQRWSSGNSLPSKAKWILALCGFPGGVFSAMLGISGGIVSNPLQQLLASIPIKNAVANTLLKATFTVPFACLMIMVMGVRSGQFDCWTPLLVALCIAPGSIVGSQLGPALTRRMSPLVAHALFGVVCFFMAVSLLFAGGGN